MTKLLIVDDRQQNLYMLQVLLSTNGFEVELASNGAEALERAHRAPPDIVISDVLMPVMDGFTLCRAWKEDERLKDIPFVFYTATYTDPKDEDFALSLGAERFIVKPVEPGKFLALLRETIETHEAGKPAAPHESIEEETYCREYNAALVRKLEDKMLQLEETNRALELDIAERKRAEAAAAQAAREWQTTFDATNDTIWILDREHRVLRANKAAERLFRRASEELIGKHCWEIVHGAAQPIPECPILRARDSLRRESMELQIGEGWFQITVDPILDAAGRYAGAVHIVSDITERKQAEAQLTEQLDELRRWHTATLGREMRVLELKREVNELLAQTGRPPRYASAEEDHP
jgi:PAS domain S-box-containing protein